MNSSTADMQYTQLGRTGFNVSVAGLGCGGFSKLGLARGNSRSEAADIVRRALDRGVNFIDTAANYGTEHVVGDAIAGRDRDSIVVSTKTSLTRDGTLLDAEQIVANLEHSLTELRTDYVDVFHLHTVEPNQIDHLVNVALPALEKSREAGKIRAIGVTEKPPVDAEHVMLEQVLADPRIEVAMIGFHLLHQNARKTIFPMARRHDVGTLGMFAVRVIFSQPDKLRDALTTLVASDQLPPEFAQNPDALDFLLTEGGAKSLIDAAYRFVRHDGGIDVVLFGTGVAAHLDSAIESILAPPLQADCVNRVHALFSHLVGVGLDAPGAR